jgi:GNAT superfamily N-acetyltransferase
MDIIYRPAKSEDLGAALEIVDRAINDLRVRHGFPSVAGARVPAFQALCLDENPEGLWVAEKEGGIVGFGFAWVFEKFWFLSQLFIDPDEQAKGIGRSLLSKARGLARIRDADNRTLIGGDMRRFPKMPA